MAKNVLTAALLVVVAAGERVSVVRTMLEIDDSAPCEVAWNETRVALGYTHVLLRGAAVAADASCAVQQSPGVCMTADKRNRLRQLGVNVILQVGGAPMSARWAACLQQATFEDSLVEAVYSPADYTTTHDGINFAFTPKVNQTSGVLDGAGQPWASKPELDSAMQALLTLISNLRTRVPRRVSLSLTLADADVVEEEPVYSHATSFNEHNVDYTIIRFGEVARPGMHGLLPQMGTPPHAECAACVAANNRYCGCAPSALSIIEGLGKQVDGLHRVVLGTCVGFSSSCSAYEATVVDKLVRPLPACAGGFAALTSENDFDVLANPAAFDAVVLSRRASCFDSVFASSVLSNGKTTLRVYHPVASEKEDPASPASVTGKKTMYEGTRYDWGSQYGDVVTTRLDVEGEARWPHTFCTADRTAWNAADPDAHFGFASEFGCGGAGAVCAEGGGNGVLGWDGGGGQLFFLKIGVGKLRRSAAGTEYRSSAEFPVAEEAAWTVEVGALSVTMTAQQTFGTWGYLLKRAIVLSPFPSDQIRVTTTLTNTGDSSFATQYAPAESFDVDGFPVAPAYSFSILASELRFPGAGGESAFDAPCALCAHIDPFPTSWRMPTDGYAFNSTPPVGANASLKGPFKGVSDLTALYVYTDTVDNSIRELLSTHKDVAGMTVHAMGLTVTPTKRLRLDASISLQNLDKGQSLTFSVDRQPSVTFRPALPQEVSVATVIEFILIILTSIGAVAGCSVYMGRKKPAAAFSGAVANTAVLEQPEEHVTLV